MDFCFKDYTTEELLQMRFFVPMQPYDAVTPFGFGLKGGREKMPVECKFVEQQHKLEDHYKCEVIPADEELIPFFGKESYYQCDFESMINRDNYIVIKTNDKQHVKEVKWREPLAGGLYVEHSGYAIAED